MVTFGKSFHFFSKSILQLVTCLGGCCVLMDSKYSKLSRKPYFYSALMFSKNTCLSFAFKKVILSKTHIFHYSQKGLFLQKWLKTVSKTKKHTHTHNTNIWTIKLPEATRKLAKMILVQNLTVKFVQNPAVKMAKIGPEPNFTEYIYIYIHIHTCAVVFARGPGCPLFRGSLKLTHLWGCWGVHLLFVIEVMYVRGSRATLQLWSILSNGAFLHRSWG